MTTVLNDNRKYRSMTEAEADTIFAEIARLEIEITKTVSGYEKRLNALKMECTDKIAADTEKLEELEKDLCAYIDANKDRFVKPRARKTTFGKYGLRSVTNVEIKDEQRVIEFADRHGLYLYKIEKKVDKTAVREALLADKPVTGAFIKSGEESFYNVAKSLIDSAAEASLCTVSPPPGKPGADGKTKASPCTDEILRAQL